LRFVPETFSSPTTVSVLASSRPEDLSDAGFEVGSSFEVSVESGEQPGEPVEIVIPLAGSGFDDGHDLFVFTFTDGAGWHALPTSFDEDSQALHAATSHFSEFSVGRFLLGLFSLGENRLYTWRRDPIPSEVLTPAEEIDRAITDSFAVWERYLDEVGITFTKSDSDAADITISWFSDEECPAFGRAESFFGHSRKINLCSSVSGYLDLRQVLVHEVGHHILGVGHLNANGCELCQWLKLCQCEAGPPVMNAVAGLPESYDDLWPEDYQWLRDKLPLTHTAPFVHTRFYIDGTVVQAAPGTDTFTASPGSDVRILVLAFDPQGTDVSLGISQVSGIDLSLDPSEPATNLGKARRDVIFTVPEVGSNASADIEITADSAGLSSRTTVTVLIKFSDQSDDSDGDGTPDDEDGCPDDPDKTEPGDCGCGKAETPGCGRPVDSDGDGTADDEDDCPDDPDKTEPGDCGCGNPETAGCGGGGGEDSAAAQYDFDEGSGSFVADDSTNGNHATTSTTSNWGTTEEAHAGASCFENANLNNGYVSVPAQVLNNSTAGAVDFWAMAYSLGGITGSERTILTHANGVNQDDISIDCTQELGFRAFFRLDNANVSTGAIADQQWYHVRVEWTGGEYRIYLNGGLKDTASQTSLLQTRSFCHIGRGMYGNSNRPWHGRIDEFKIESRGTSGGDRDGDGTPDHEDGCPDDPDKIDPGDCGCGFSDIDSDFDGTSDCDDGCPDDSEKIDPGECGCGNPEIQGCGEQGEASWTLRATTGPSPRYAHAIAYDSARGVTVLFGGWDGSRNGETWEWNGATWTLRATTGPSPREDHALAYDSARGVTVLFGGFDGSYDGETWEWDGATWTLRATTGPSARYWHALAYDSARGVTVLFGGWDGWYDGETWEWDGATWTLRDNTGLSPFFWHPLAYDSARGITVLFGRYNDDFRYDGETWEWDGGTWTRRASGGPSARDDHALAYDIARGVTVLFGGDDGRRNGETWEWDGAAWTLRATTGPSPREYHALAYDSARGVTVLFGGTTDDGINSETWEWDGRTP
jgi:hypothetical protein